MKFSSAFLLFGAIFLPVFHSCEYKLDSQHFRDLQELDSTWSIQVDLTPETFPEVIEEPVLIKYRFYPTDLNLLKVQVVLDDTYTLFESTKEQDSLLVSPYDFEPGNRKLSIVFITDSKSGSLADLTGYEAVGFHRDWEFYKPNICYSGICIRNIYNDTGLLKITWDTTTMSGFRKYRVNKMCEFFDAPRVIAEITDRSQTEYHDREYFGGWADYSLEAETDNGTRYSSAASVYYLFPALQVLWIKDNNIQLYWNKSAFDKVVLGYELSYADSDTTNSILYTSDNPMDTTYLLWGTPTYSIVKYKLRIKIQDPESGQPGWSDFYTTTQLTYKPKIHLKK